jgi:hypothetical protein
VDVVFLRSRGLEAHLVLTARPKTRDGWTRIETIRTLVSGLNRLGAYNGITGMKHAILLALSIGFDVAAQSVTVPLNLPAVRKEVSHYGRGEMV